MAANANSRITSVDFVVQPKEDLHLQGALRKLPRVSKGENYPCQMQKTQTFSCLFRHYAKHNGLRKEDLIFSFVDELLPDQTPESVHLMPQDEIYVEHRQQSLAEDDIPSLEEDQYAENFRQLLDSGKHTDITFVVGECDTEICAHKCILSARSEYFEAMFREGGMAESLQNTIVFKKHDAPTFRRMLEFLYADSVKDLNSCTGDDILMLLVLSNELLLPSLTEMCESAASRVITAQNVTKFLLLSSTSSVLRQACARFVHLNVSNLIGDFSFRSQVETCPELGLLLFEASMAANGGDYTNSQESTGSGRFDNKRRRVTGNELGNSSSNSNNNSQIEADPAASNTIAPQNAHVQDY